MKRQQAKEKVSLLALQQGMTLFRRENAIVGLKPDGSEKIIVQAKDDQEVWEEALKVLQPKPKKDKKDKKTTHYKILKMYADGGSRGNPGPSASGYVIMTTDDEVLEEGGEYLGITTNNQAEYQAVRLGLQEIAKYQPEEIQIYLDSMLVVNQLNGVYKIRNKDLWPIHQDIIELLKRSKKNTVKHVYRHHNKLADAQVNIVLDSHTDKN